MRYALRVGAAAALVAAMIWAATLSVAYQPGLAKEFEAAAQTAQAEGNYAAAVREYRRMLELYPNEPGIRAPIYLAMSVASEKSGDADHAAEFAATANALDPTLESRVAGAGAGDPSTRGAADKLRTALAIMQTAVATAGAISAVIPQRPPQPGYAPPGVPTGYAPPGAPTGYAPPGAPTGYAPPGAPTGYAPPGAPTGYAPPPTPDPNAVQPGYPPPGAPTGYAPPAVQPGYPPPVPDPNAPPAGYQPPPGQPGYPPQAAQPGGYPPPPNQPGYQPQPGQPGYPPQAAQPGGYPPPQPQPGGYQPPPNQAGYPPPPGQPGYPQAAQPGGYQPQPNQAGYQPPPGQPGYPQQPPQSGQAYPQQQAPAGYPQQQAQPGRTSMAQSGAYRARLNDRPPGARTRGEGNAPVIVVHDHFRLGEPNYFEHNCSAILSVEGGELQFIPSAAGEDARAIPASEITEIRLNLVVGREIGAFHISTKKGLYLQLALDSGSRDDARAAVETLNRQLGLGQ